LLAAPLVALALGVTACSGQHGESIGQSDSKVLADDVWPTNETTTSITIAWDYVCESDCGPLAGLELKRVGPTNTTLWQTVQTWGPDVSSGTFTDNNLQNGTLYQYQLCADYMSGGQQCTGSHYVRTLGTAPPSPPPPPPPPPPTPAAPWKWNRPIELIWPQDANVFVPGGGVAEVQRVWWFVDTYAIGYDGKLWSTGDWYNGGWHGSLPVAGAQNDAVFVPGGGIAAVSRISSMIDLFTIGYDGKLWSPGSYMPDQKWHGACPIIEPANPWVFKPGGGIAAVSRNVHILDTFAVGYDGYIYDTGWWDEDGWHAAYPLPRNGAVFVPGGGITAASNNRDTLDVYTIGYDGKLWVAGSWNGSSWDPAHPAPVDWSPWGAQNFIPGSQLASFSVEGITHVFVIGRDSVMWDFAQDQNTKSFVLNRDGWPGVVFTPGGGIGASAGWNGPQNPVLMNTVTIGYDKHAWSPSSYGPPF
jgi:hypothetical protein